MDRRRSGRKTQQVGQTCEIRIVATVQLTWADRAIECFAPAEAVVITDGTSTCLQGWRYTRGLDRMIMSVHPLVYLSRLPQAPNKSIRRLHAKILAANRGTYGTWWNIKHAILRSYERCYQKYIKQRLEELEKPGLHFVLRELERTR